jgi:hypothetical protein
VKKRSSDHPKPPKTIVSRTVADERRWWRDAKASNAPPNGKLYRGWMIWMKMRELAADLLAREKVEEKNTFF